MSDGFDFDRVIDRTNTNSLKFDFRVERGYPEDVLPLWVADMDFRTAEPVIEALRRMADHGIFGYSDVKDPYYEAVLGWFSGRFGWDAERDWVVKTPGVVYALAMAVQSFTEPGDGVLVQTPVYYPFFGVVRDNGRRLVECPLVCEDGEYSIDYDDFERRIVEGGVRMLCLCSPHNPVGRVWTGDELREMGRICAEHDVIVVSDEIHCDFVWPGHEHRVFCEAVPEMADRSVVCTAPSKSFNLAGLQASNVFIPDAGLRERFSASMRRSGYSQLNAMGLVATEAAYSHGEEWLEACKAYIHANLEFVSSYIERELPELRMRVPEGTYFAWVDCTALGLGAKELDELIVHDARLWLDAGHIFGKEGEGFQRFVTACPRSVLEEAMDRFRDAIRGLGR